MGFVQGTFNQIRLLQIKIKDIFGAYVTITNSSLGEPFGNFTFNLQTTEVIPQIRLKTLTGNVRDNKHLYIKIEAQEQGENLPQSAKFSYGLWSFEPVPDINAQIHQLIDKGIGYIKKHLEEKGNVYFVEECNYKPLYINDDGHVQSLYYQLVELVNNDVLTIHLTDGTLLFENQLTPNHVMDIITQLFEQTK